MSQEAPLLKLPVQLEQRIVWLRRNTNMVDSLDDRMTRQRKLVQKLLAKHGMTLEELLAVPFTDIEKYDEEMQLWYHILRDCDYVDSLR